MPPQDPRYPVNQPSPDQTFKQEGVSANGQPTQIVYVTRPHDVPQPQISDETRRLHEASKAKYPNLNLSDGEYIIRAISRHPIGLLQIWAGVGLVIAAMLAVFGFYVTSSNDPATSLGGSPLSPEVMSIPVVLLSALVLLFGFIAASVYNGNKFFLTNESVIQIIQTSVFSKREQTVSLGNIEDASFTKHGFLQYMLDFGSIRLSTEGDETTYRFHYAADPQKQIAILNNAVESFKNGRPVTMANIDH
jgi:hypothetical protein